LFKQKHQLVKLNPYKCTYVIQGPSIFHSHVLCISLTVNSVAKAYSMSYLKETLTDQYVSTSFS